MEQEGTPAHILADFEQLLQFHCATFMDNDIAGQPQAMQSSGRPIKSVRARLKGKEGRLRGNLMGKRVNFSARTVITGDPLLELDEVGVPKSIARNLTYPERVTAYNRAWLSELVRNGPNDYPGANTSSRDTGERIDLKYNRRSDMALQPGWIVERHLKDGDYILFNRHALWYSKVLAPRLSAGLPAGCSRCSSGSPTGTGVVPMPCILKPKPYWSGKQILSMCIPKGINVFLDKDKGLKNNFLKDDGVCIENGEIMYGVINKKVVGASAGGLIHIIFREKGPVVCKRFFSGVQRVVNFWLLHNGFSIGIGDTVADKATTDSINQTISDAKAAVMDYIEYARHDWLKVEAGMTLRESFEANVNRVLNQARDDVGNHAEISLPDFNNVKQMVVAGSKGSFINISQMSACVGQQSVEGKRIPFGFRHRSLPHFTKDDFTPESRGFVENSYLRGLTAQEFFFHAMAGREGLIDTAVKTAETGYIQRRLVKALEDVMVCYDGTVRNSTNNVIQFAYGEDGIDGAQVETQTLLTLKLNDADFRHMFHVDLHDGGFRKGSLRPRSWRLVPGASGPAR
ncbi:hypothetical protein L1887_60032 [Cichorium endivia]|nr:hypothetical protein L1887_60032 [Cichorium endivia]